ncbi:MAG: hypothetical protein ACI4AX_07995 [Muribaculaceae bacterium]
MTLLLGILKIIAIVVIIFLAIACIGAGFILCKWFTDDLNDYYEGERERKREELCEKQRAKLKACRDEEKRRKGIPVK